MLYPRVNPAPLIVSGVHPTLVSEAPQPTRREHRSLLAHPERKDHHHGTQP